MQVVCQGPGCEVVFDAVRRNAKYHSDTCRQRARRHPDQVGRGKAVKPRRRRRLQAAVERELRKAGRRSSVAGISALELAERIDAGAESGAALAALAKELSAAMDRALAASEEGDPIGARRDEVAERRERRRRAVR